MTKLIDEKPRGSIDLDKGEVLDFIRWNSSDAEQIALQLVSRIRKARSEGSSIGVMGCFVVQTQPPDGNTYECFMSHMPLEYSNWAADLLKARLRGAAEGTL